MSRRVVLTITGTRDRACAEAQTSVALPHVAAVAAAGTALDKKGNNLTRCSF